MDATSVGFNDEQWEFAHRPTYAELVAENRRLTSLVAKLEARIGELELALEKASREGKRQAAPFARKTSR